MKKDQPGNRVRPLLFNAGISGVSPKSPTVRVQPIKVDTSQGFEVPIYNTLLAQSTPSTPNIFDKKC